MAITEALARKQLKRFGSYIPLPPAEELHRRVSAFMAEAADPDHAERMTGWMEKSLHYFPKIADIHEAAEATLQNMGVPDFEGLGSKCELCQDTGWTSRDRDGISIATRCACIPPAEPEQDKARTGRQA